MESPYSSIKLFYAHFVIFANYFIGPESLEFFKNMFKMNIKVRKLMNDYTLVMTWVIKTP